MGVVLALLSVHAVLRAAEPVSPAAVEARVAELLKKFTLEEKVDFIGGGGFTIRGNKRLNIPDIRMSDGPVGVRCAGPSTAYPAGTALAATWNVALAREEGSAMARDARARGIHIVLGPGVNMYRLPTGGMNFEYYGEDHHLASRITVAFVQGMQGQGVAATVKHFLGNEVENNRGGYSAEMDERTLREVYLAPFQAAIQEGQAWCLMAAYNRYQGVHCAHQDWLTNQILKKELAWPGVMMSDWGAVHDALGAFNGGLDLEMPSGRNMNRAKLLPLLQEGKITEAVLDEKVRRILRLIVSLGWLDRPQEDKSIPKDDPASAKVALQVAREGTVLLKNEGHLLPLDTRKLKSLAVVGPNADPAVTGGGGSSHTGPLHSVSLLAGLKARLGEGVKVFHYPSAAPLNYDSFYAQSRYAGPLRAEFFNKGDTKAPPALARDEARVSLNATKAPPGPGVNAAGYLARWTGKLRAEKPGACRFVARHTGTLSVRLDDKEILAQVYSGRGAPNLVTADVPLEAGRDYALRVEFSDTQKEKVLQFGWGPVPPLIPEDVAAQIAQADALILSVGHSGRTESEGHDHIYELPRGQEELVLAAVALNPRAILVLNGGGGVATANWVGRVPALLHAFYPGQEGGMALAEILCGDVNPSGRLPMTLEKRWEDIPACAFTEKDGKIAYEEGVFVGYRHYDKKQLEPLFAFGYGLSYTSFTYANLAVTPARLKADGKVEVSCEVRNTGAVSGAETVQLYVEDVEASVPRPVKELKAFQKVFLKAGETQRVAFTLDAKALSFFDVKTRKWVAEPGTFRVHVGSSARDIRLTGNFNLD